MLHKVTTERAEAYRLFHEGSIALARAEIAGIRADEDYFNKTIESQNQAIIDCKLALAKTKLGSAWQKVYGNDVKYGSGDQLRGILYQHLKLEPLNQTEKGVPAVDEPTLVQLKKKVPGIEELLKLRKMEKITGTYLKGFQSEIVNGFIHPMFNLTTVRTYRSSSNKPNFQNIPKRDKDLMRLIRSGLFARKGHQLVEVDYSGLEVSIAACYHQDPTMLTYLLKANTDMHGDVSQLCFFLTDYTKAKYGHVRNAIKNSFVFPQFYGDYYGNCAKGLCEWLELPKGGRFDGKGWLMPNGTPIGTHLHNNGVTGFDKFLNHLQKMEEDFWQVRFKVYAKWKEAHYASYLKNGYVDSFTGFRCWGPMSKNDAINYPVQGAAFHCLLWAFVEIQKIAIAENWDSRLIGQIHDALIGDVNPQEINHVLRTINRVCTVELPKAWDWICVPLKIEAEATEVDGSWADIKHFDLGSILQ